jgi:hypothetical protein
MNFWSGHERPNAATVLHNTFSFERGECVAGGHQADLMNFRQVAFGRDGITRL